MPRDATQVWEDELLRELLELYKAVKFDDRTADIMHDIGVHASEGRRDGISEEPRMSYIFEAL